MPNGASQDTQISDTVVSLRSVTKVFKQRQRPSSIRDSLSSWWRPEFKEITALDDVSLHVARGEVLAYAGPNGAGKSTTIKLLSGIFSPDKGTVRSLGMDPVRNRLTYVSSIAVVFGQRTELWWDHSVEASFRWKKSVWNISDEVYHQQILNLYDVFDLAPIWRSLAKDLSLGQRMRADLALAMLHDPQLILLDEPTLGLDVDARQKMLSFIKGLNVEKQKTIIVTSHNMSDLEHLGSRVVLIHNGSLRFDGSFEELRGSVDDFRKITIETDSTEAPVLSDALFEGSHGNRHTYSFDSTKSQITTLIRQAESQFKVADVLSERASIDDVISRVYGNLRRGLDT